ncbi:unnamed protein product [Cyprideis torosa]|uniref:Uncharacterized protein n=1 Tax=Cyprideis torosa TaxID=163714 RepID=A0A7R8ZPG0_9CRUS|nr:unnamed protein product [Cyprideis torosa]CAG0888325.1 unnamed protein product [Cyprideis torosa]
MLKKELRRAKLEKHARPLVFVAMSQPSIRIHAAGRQRNALLRRILQREGMRHPCLMFCQVHLLSRSNPYKSTYIFNQSFPPAVQHPPSHHVGGRERKRKQAEIDRKKAEVRKRLEEASKSKQKAKKGFMTPERKKKLRLLLRKKAAEELKKEQERKAQERRRIIQERCGTAKSLDGANEAQVREICHNYQAKIEKLEGDKIDLEWETYKREGELKAICQDYFGRVYQCESQKWDLEWEVMKREFEINLLNSQVNDLRGKFVKPTLKKVSKYENKFAKLQKKAAEFNFRNTLKTVKKKEFMLEEEEKEASPDPQSPTERTFKKVKEFKKDKKIVDSLSRSRRKSEQQRTIKEEFQLKKKDKVEEAAA